MGRRKSVEEEVLENQTEESVEEEIVDEAETVEAELLTETEEPVEEKAEAPKRRQRRPRKPKTPELSVENAAKEVEDTTQVEAVEETPEVTKQPQRRSRKNAEPNYKEDLEVAATAMQKSMDSMVKQWTAIEQISGQVSSHFEKVTQALKPKPEYLDTQDLIRPQLANRPPFITKFATAASIVAVVFSLVSLSLSQSARQVALNAEATRLTQSAFFQKQAGDSKQREPELAVAPRESSHKGTDFLSNPKRTNQRNRR